MPGPGQPHAARADHTFVGGQSGTLVDVADVCAVLELVALVEGLVGVAETLVDVDVLGEELLHVVGTVVVGVCLGCHHQPGLDLDRTSSSSTRNSFATAFAPWPMTACPALKFAAAA